MQINKELMSRAVKHFKTYGTITKIFCMYKYKIDFEAATVICSAIAKRFPNLWRDSHENFISKAVNKSVRIVL